MKESYVLQAQSRQDLGKGASRRLRRTNQVPAIVYGAPGEPQSIQLSHNELLKNLKNPKIFSHVLTLNCDGKPEQVIIKALHRHPFKPQVMHVDFQRVDASHALHVHVPLQFINEDKAPGIKRGGIFNHLKNEVEVSCLPKDLPEYLQVDVGTMDVGDSLHLSQIVLPAGVEIIELSHGEEHDHSVVNLTLPRAAAVEDLNSTPVAPPPPPASSEKLPKGD